MTTTLRATPRTRVRRLPKRGSHDLETIHAILDEGLVCHVGFVADGQPFVIPTGYARDGDTLFLHGSPASRMLKHLEGGEPVSVTVTLLDGVVMARSAFHSSMNYRSVVILGRGTKITGREEKLAAMRALVEHIIPGRWDDLRPPTDKELKATAIVAIPITEGSAKVRTGGPKDDDEDYALPIWAGVVPLTMRQSAPVPDNRLHAEATLPPYARRYQRPGQSWPEDSKRA